MSREHRNTARLAVTTAVIIGLAAAALFFRPASREQPGASQATPATEGLVKFLMEQQWLIKMKLALVEEANLAPQIHSTGRVVVVPSHRAILSPPVAGIVANGALPRIGQQVTQGQRLATLIQTATAAESAQIRIENNRIEAERRRLAQAEVEAMARLNVAAAEAARARRLFEKKAYSQRQLEVADAEHKAGEATLASMREQFKALQTSQSASTYEVTAPISGAVVAVYKSVGEQVGPGDAILEIVALSTVWVEAPVFEKDLGRLRGNSGALFTTPAYPGREFAGRLVSVGSVVDGLTRAATVTFEVNNAGGELRIGMLANLRLDGGERQRVLLVPRESIVDNEGKKIVYVLLSGEHFERRNVETGGEYGSKVAVISGVKPGERVVTQGAYQLRLQELRPADTGVHSHET